MKLTDQIKDRWNGKLLCGGLTLEVVLERHKQWLRDEEGGEKANLSEANLSKADLSWADLSGADLSWADLSWADLSGADLSGADLSWANLSWANLSGADLSKADLSWADLSGADLSKADLSWADLSWADLSWADLSWADLSWANLSKANLSEANLSKADLSKADLSEANLSGAFNVNYRLFKHDLWGVLLRYPNEIPGLLKAMNEGKIDGSIYSGSCACLVGTIANVKGCGVESLLKDASSPAERWFMQFVPEMTIENSAAMKLTAEWIEEFQQLYGERVAA